MQILEYQDAIKAARAGKTVIVLPKNANPNYLAVGPQRYHPCAIPVEAGLDQRETVWSYSAAKESVLDVFSNEPDVSHSKVTAWLVPEPTKKETA